MENALMSKAIQEHPYFAAFSKAEQEIIEKNVYYRHYKKGQVLFDMEDKRDRIFILDEGLIRIEKVDYTATYNFIEFVDDRLPFPLSGMFDSQNYYFSAIAMTDIHTFYIPTNVFEKIIQENSDQLRLLNAGLSRQLERQMRRLQYCVTSKAKERVKNALSLLMNDLGITEDCQISIPYPIQINEVARYSGTTRETVGQVIRELVEEEKLIYQYKQFIFRDIDYFNLGK